MLSKTGQGLVPILFRIYILPLLTLLPYLEISYHCYADDTQIYIPCQHDKFSHYIASIILSYNLISSWLSNNYLKLNHNKSKPIIIGSLAIVARCKLMSWEISLGESTINFSPTVKNLGIFFDESLNFNDHIKYCKNRAFKT